MAEILLEGRDCETCGTEVRKGALFCYHCGESVAPDVAVTTDGDHEKVSDAWLREDITETAAANEEKIKGDEKAEVIEDSEVVEEDKKPEPSEDVEEISEDEPSIIEDRPETAAEETKIETETEAEKEEKTKLTSAAAMRRKPKRIQKKRVEIVWDEPQSPPNVWFLVATLLFAILAVGLWFVAKYLG